MRSTHPYPHPQGQRPPFRRPDDDDNPRPFESDDRPGRGHRGGPRGRGRQRRGRMGRGDVPAAVLALLAEEPMHGYQLMQAIRERSGGRWTPSPGAIYPAINLLEDEGLVTVTAESGRRLVALTDAGRARAEALADQRPDPFATPEAAPAGPDLRSLVAQLHDATRQVARSGSVTQVEAAAKILSDARRSIYLLLAEGPDESPGESTGESTGPDEADAR